MMLNIFVGFSLAALASAGQQLSSWDALSPFSLPLVTDADSILANSANSAHASHHHCQHKGNQSESVCVYSSRHFALGRGISIVTTQESMRRIQQLPAWTGKAQYKSSRINEQPPSPPFEERDLPGRGKGLIANRTLHRGDRIFAHTPILLLHEEASDGLDKDAWAGLETAAVGELPTRAKTLFWGLFGQPSHGPAGGRIDTNAFAVDIDDAEHYAVFPEIARLNHDCRPNAAYFFDQATLTHYVHALTDIHPGTELTITYVDPHLSRQDRLDALSHSWGFTCSCSTCTLDAHLSRASDERLEQIEEINDLFDDDDEPTSPDMALALIGLYEQERLHGPIANAYRLAAKAFCEQGKRWNAVKYANLAADVGMLENGFRDEDVSEMRRLAEDPDEQPCWRRAKAAKLKA